MPSICTWTGQSESPYPFEVHELPRGWEIQPKLFNNALSAIYIFTSLGSNEYVPIYIGQTPNISERFFDLHKMDEIKKYAPTHIHIRVSHNKITRLNEERDLIESCQPVLNDCSKLNGCSKLSDRSVEYAGPEIG